MRKELLGIFLFFLVLFTLASLISYHHTDPSVFHPSASGNIHNLFGLLGAQTAGLLIGLFGFGAFWFPPFLLMFSILFFRNAPREEMALPLTGVFIAILVTGSFFALWQNDYTFLGTRIPGGGAVGTVLKSFISRYFGRLGGAIVLIMSGLVAFILTTGMSLNDCWRRIERFSEGKGEYLLDLCHDIRGTGLFSQAILPRLPKLPSMSNARQLSVRPVPVLDDDPEDDMPESATVLTEVAAEPATPEETAPAKSPKKPKDRDGERLPSDALLSEPAPRPVSSDRAHLKKQSERLSQKLADFGIKGEVVNEYPGPVITTFEYKPAAGVKINKIVNLTDDLALALRAMSIRIVAPIPGKAVIGIEIPNAERELVGLKEIVASEAFRKSESKLTICMGKDIVGNPVISHLDRMPHLLIAGATGTGKSVFLNTLICSLIYKSEPDEVKFIMIDPKRIELSMYDGIPHLITPVVTDVKKATHALYWAVSEMERRYELLSELRVRNISQYNRKAATERKRDALPYIVLIIDELADLMIVASRDVETSLTRLAQMARAAGIHLILATQRPSVDVLTGIIKANFPTRLTFRVSSKIDSRTVIDANGAETLLGNGDMLFLPPGTATLQRIHGAYISEEEVIQITEFLKQQRKPEYDKRVVESPFKKSRQTSLDNYDEYYDDAVSLVTQTRQASAPLLQRQLRIGPARAARLLKLMEKEGVVGPSDGTDAREVLVRGYDGKV